MLKNKFKTKGQAIHANKKNLIFFFSDMIIEKTQYH